MNFTVTHPRPEWASCCRLSILLLHRLQDMNNNSHAASSDRHILTSTHVIKFSLGRNAA